MGKAKITRRIEVWFKDWVSEEKAREALKKLGLSPKPLAGHFAKGVTLNVVVSAKKAEEWTEKLRKDFHIQEVRDWPS